MKMVESNSSGERRQHSRYPVAVRVHVAQLGEVSGGLTRDFSATGLFIETRVLYTVGVSLSVRVMHPRSGAQIPILCRVVRHELGPDGKPVGLGLEISDCTPESRAALASIFDGARNPSAPAVEQPVTSAPPREVADGFVQQEVREYLSDAIRAERAGRLSEAVDILERALSLKSVQTVEIATRLARIAMGPMANPQAARAYAKLVEEREPGAETTTRLFSEITECERSLSNNRAATGGKRHAPSTPRARESRRQRSQVIVAVALGLGFVGLLGLMGWRYLLPRGPTPIVVDVRALSRYLPAVSSQVSDGRLYVKVDGRWDAVPRPEKEKGLKALAGFGVEHYRVSEVVVFDNKPVLVATVRGEAVQILR